MNRSSNYIKIQRDIYFFFFKEALCFFSDSLIAVDNPSCHSWLEIALVAKAGINNFTICHKTMKKIILAISILNCFCACTQEESNEGKTIAEPTMYFDEGELADDFWADSLHNLFYTNELAKLKEPPIRDSVNKSKIIRLTVFPFKYNPYCIRIDRIDSTNIVIYKIASDDADFRRTGLNNFTMRYESDFGKMDSLYSNLKAKIDSFDIFNHNNKTPEEVIRLGITGADGDYYLLEYCDGGKYKVINWWNGWLEAGYYEDSKGFINILHDIHSFVPSALFPDLRSARKLEDVRFPVFKSENDVSKFLQIENNK